MIRKPWIRAVCASVLGLGILGIGGGPAYAGGPAGTRCEAGCLLPPTGLIAWWPGDNNANDVQLGNTAEPMNGADFGQGLVGRAFHFNGNDAFVNVPDTPQFHAITSAVTVDAWINPTLAPVGGGYVFAHRDPLVNEGFTLAINNDGFLITVLGTDLIYTANSSVPVIAFDGQWKHIALTADTRSGTLTLYLNGESVPLVSDGAISGNITTATHTFIGQRQDSATEEGPIFAQHYAGLIDEVEVFNRALSAAEIKAIFRIGALGKCKPPAVQ